MPFRTLGLDPSADAAAVRRAYARLLKRNRPDDDPVAFQELNEAYHACLDEIRQREGGEAENRDGFESGTGASTRHPLHAVDSLPPLADSTVSPHAETAQPDAVAETFDLEAFLDDLFDRIDRDTPADMLAWLAAHPDLYSISLKSAITVQVLSAVAEREPPVAIDMQDAIAEFFAAASLGPRDWWLLERLEANRTRARTLSRFRGGALPRANQAEEPRYFDLLMDAELVKSGIGWRAWLLMLVPGLPSRIVARAGELDALTEGASEDLVNAPLVHLATRLCDRTRIRLSRLLLTWTRVAVFTSLAIVLLWLMAGNPWRDLVRFGITCGLVFTGWQVATAVTLAFRRLFESRGYGHLAREAGALLLAIAALAVSAWIPSLPRSIGYVLGVMAVARAATLLRFWPGYALVAMFGASDWILTSTGLYSLPLPPMLAGIVAASVSILVLDRWQARRTGLEVETIVASGASWVRQGRVLLLFLTTLLATVLASAVFLRR